MVAPTIPGDLLKALPQRPVALRAPPPTAQGGAVGAIVLLLVMLGALLAWLGPGIVDDWRMRHDAVAAPDITAKEARCRSWLYIFQFCTVTLDDGSHGRERTLRYAFIDDPGAQPMGLRRDRSDPARITTEFGLQQLYSRVVTLLLFGGILVACVGAALSVLWKGLSAQRALAGMSGQPLTPIIVQVERNNRLLPRKRLWVFLYDDDGGRRERALVEWPSRQRPLFTGADETWALALRGPQGGPPLLLDADLKEIDLTDSEKAAFLEAFRAAFGDPAGKEGTGLA